MYVLRCLCVHVYTYIRMYMCNAYICINVQLCKDISMRILGISNILKFIYICTYTCKQIFLHVDRNVYTSTHIHTTGWRRPIGCLISQITFRKLATNHRALLRKKTYKDKASYDSTPPCSLRTERVLL